MKLLLLVGLQVDLMPGGPAEVPESDLLVPVINDLIEKFDLVAAANFNMPANHITFAGNHPWRYPGQTIDIGGSPTLLQPIFCVPGTFGSEFMPGLRSKLISQTFLMGTQPDTPPYSAFFDSEKKHSTGLIDYLMTNNIKELYIAGLPLESTVKNSALDSNAAGFATFIIGNACKEREGKHAELIKELAQSGIKIITTDNLE